jgi:hypothetical protein
MPDPTLVGALLAVPFGTIWACWEIFLRSSINDAPRCFKKDGWRSACSWRGDRDRSRPRTCGPAHDLHVVADGASVASTHTFHPHSGPWRTGLPLRIRAARCLPPLRSDASNQSG